MNDICKILKDSKTVAVVGISRNEMKPSRDIAHYLLAQGYEVYGVNPTLEKAGKISVFPSLKDIPVKIDIVNVFRRSETIPELLPDILTVKPKVLWLQLGIYNDDVIRVAEKEGIIGIQDRCILVEHTRCV